MTRSVADRPLSGGRWMRGIIVPAALAAGVAGWCAPGDAARAATPGTGPETRAALTGSGAPEVMLYAAASLRDALQSIAPVCGKEAGARLLFNFGGSNDLARQILAADKADLFFPADESWMDMVAADGLIDPGSRRSLLSNRLVIVVPSRDPVSISGPAGLAGPGVKRIALADPDAVPAGRYARAWLEQAHQWEAVRDRVVPALDVRAALAAVESGAVQAGLVYRTDAAISRKVTVAYEVPDTEGPRISYPVAALRNRPQRDAAGRVLQCLLGDQAATIFEAFGFIVLRGAP